MSFLVSPEKTLFFLKWLCGLMPTGRGKVELSFHFPFISLWDPRVVHIPTVSFSIIAWKRLYMPYVCCSSGPMNNPMAIKGLLLLPSISSTSPIRIPHCPTSWRMVSSLLTQKLGRIYWVCIFSLYLYNEKRQITCGGGKAEHGGNY